MMFAHAMTLARRRFGNADPGRPRPQITHATPVTRPGINHPGDILRGCPLLRRPPSGVVTFLFTYIEGSTRRWEADADAMRAALLAHDEVLHQAVTADRPRRQGER